MNLWLLSAAIAASAVCGVHLFVGGRLFAPPLLRSALHGPVKHTHYYCWHLVTLTLALMAVAFAWAAFEPSAIEAALFALALSAAFAVWNAAQNLAMGLSFAKHPQGGFFLIVTLLAAAGVAHG